MLQPVPPPFGPSGRLGHLDHLCLQIRMQEYAYNMEMQAQSYREGMPDGRCGHERKKAFPYTPPIFCAIEGVLDFIRAGISFWTPPNVGQSMRLMKSFSDSDRWDWFAAGDKTVAKWGNLSRSGSNSEQRILFEIGLTMGIPLAVAALVGMAFVR